MTVTVAGRDPAELLANRRGCRGRGARLRRGGASPKRDHDGNRNPTGRVVAGAILREVETNDIGEEKTNRNVGCGVIVNVKPDRQSRKTFRNFCDARGVFPEPAQENGLKDGQYNRRTGVPEEVDSVVTSWLLVAPGEVLTELLGFDEDGRWVHAQKPYVESWQFRLNVRIPVHAPGSAEERPRASSGTQFGRPETVKATEAALHADRQRRESERLREEAAGLPVE